MSLIKQLNNEVSDAIHAYMQQNMQPPKVIVYVNPETWAELMHESGNGSMSPSAHELQTQHTVMGFPVYTATASYTSRGERREHPPWTIAVWRQF